jgi:hypothetical protein
VNGGEKARAIRRRLVRHMTLETTSSMLPETAMANHPKNRETRLIDPATGKFFH